MSAGVSAARSQAAPPARSRTVDETKSKISLYPRNRFTASLSCPGVRATRTKVPPCWLSCSWWHLSHQNGITLE